MLLPLYGRSIKLYATSPPSGKFYGIVVFSFDKRMVCPIQTLAE
jgi:hypothetical protein